MNDVNDICVTIRLMTVEDAPFVAQIEKNAFSQPWPETEFVKAVLSDNYVYIAAELDGKIIGYAGCVFAAEDADITNIAVDADYRGLGIGAELLKQLIVQAERRGSDNIFLEVRQSNFAAINLYTQYGFAQNGIRRNFYQKPAEDAILMAKKLH